MGAPTVVAAIGERRVVGIDPTVAGVRAQVAEGGLLDGPAGVVVMLSGGRDSVCLLDVAVDICGPERVAALHVNYGLRGDESAADERHCGALCEQLGVTLHVVAARREDHSAGNLQAWARDVRYEAAMELAQSSDGPGPAGADGAPVDSPTGLAPTRVAAGHTASDQVETILYRLAASPGRRALLGMPVQSGRLVRPLLAVTRDQTAAYCRARGLAWRDDATNESERYARVRVRKDLLGALRGVHPGAEANVLRTAALLREETALLEGLVDEELAGVGEITIARLQELAPALQRLVVTRLAEDATGGFAPQAGDRVADILELAGSEGTEGGGAGGRRASVQLHVGGSAAAVIRAGVLRMIKLEPRRGGPGA